MRTRCLPVTGAVAAAFVFGVCAITVNAQDFRYGMPQTLYLKNVEDVSYTFDSSPLVIPFTLEGTQASVRLVVYTGEAGPHDTLVYTSPAPVIF